MNLREKLAEPFDGLRTETLNELEKIANDYANELLEQYKQIYTTPQAIIDVVLKNPPYEPI